MQIPIYQVDAFTKKLFGGNPAAICPLETWLSDDLLQLIAAENNLSETAFYIPLDDQFALRWFTPVSEVDLCGHATLATAHVLYSELGHSASSLSFQTRSGLLTVQQSDQGYVMNFPVDLISPLSTPVELLEGLHVVPLETFRGKTDYMAVIESQEELLALKPDFRILAKGNVRGTIVTAPGREVDFVSRCFFPQYGIDEDPVTGSAHTTLTPYWAARLNKQRLTARQLSSRQGELVCSLVDDRVELTGQAVTYLKGTIRV